MRKKRGIPEYVFWGIAACCIAFFIIMGIGGISYTGTEIALGVAFWWANILLSVLTVRFKYSFRSRISYYACLIVYAAFAIHQSVFWIGSYLMWRYPAHPPLKFGPGRLGSSRGNEGSDISFLTPHKAGLKPKEERNE